MAIAGCRRSAGTGIVLLLVLGLVVPTGRQRNPSAGDTPETRAVFYVS